MAETIKRDDRLFTVDEACEYLRISPASFYRLRRDGKLKAVRVGGGLRIDPSELRAFVQRNVSERTGDA
jgi:excisionase family DNA binding protein